MNEDNGRAVSRRVAVGFIDRKRDIASGDFLGGRKIVHMCNFARSIAADKRNVQSAFVIAASNSFRPVRYAIKKHYE
ncbi:MAG: hypothetical protein DHS20C04_20020 [Hyphococcus sp.]|nr:MAG: hypothetical protein DHS20C04_20020 [Marinicaulis sp.]